MVVLILTSGLDFTHKQGQADLDGESCIMCCLLLFMSGELYQEQAVLCSSVGFSPDCVTVCLVMHHCRHHTAHSNMLQKSILTCSQLPTHTGDSLLSRRLSAHFQKGSPFFSNPVIKISMGEMMCSCRAHTQKHTLVPSVQCASAETES